MDKVSHHLVLSDNRSGYKGELKRGDTNLFYQRSLYTLLFIIYLAVLGFSCRMQTLSCCLWNQFPWPGFKPWAPALGVQGLSHWTTTEVPHVTVNMGGVTLTYCSLVNPAKISWLKTTVIMVSVGQRFGKVMVGGFLLGIFQVVVRQGRSWKSINLQYIRRLARCLSLFMWSLHELVGFPHSMVATGW